MKLKKKLAKPTTLGHGMRHRSVLRLGTGARHCGLAFGGPRHEVVTEIDTVS